MQLKIKAYQPLKKLIVDPVIKEFFKLPDYCPWKSKSPQCHQNGSELLSSPSTKETM